MQNTTDNIYILVILGMGGTFLLVVSFILFSIRNQNKLLRQRQHFQQAQIDHQKELLRAVIESQEAERKRIGQDLHDDVGTTVSGLRLLIEMFKPGDDVKAHEDFTQSTKTIIDKVVKDVRNISHNYRRQHSGTMAWQQP
jgi:signal transduction histidine kinase